ncbi:hypothetical protein FA15DRAFT_760467 [Coprinopsis marcescibilis]|uniref:Uncharacterized protein n=1 Tax=Coprinopsis marcescibilis TaxID=230819 RepID=A0A5C3KFV8_COPMA|nr:hypothetical protein FA15DRAFT_760467 [Coprinopsis marcescibilis]
MVRFKNRWLLVEFIPISQAQSSITTAVTSNLDGKLIWGALRQSILTNFGDTGWGAVASSLTVKYYSPTTNTAIIRVSRDHHKIAWAGLAMITTIDGTRYIPNVVHLSGTIKHAQLSAIQHNRVVVARYRALAKTPSGYQDSYDTFLEKSTLEIQALQD